MSDPLAPASAPAADASRGDALAAAFAAARDDPSLAILEGFHTLKHALRFGASVTHVVTSDPAELAALAAALAPDVADELARLALPLAPAELRALGFPARPTPASLGSPAARRSPCGRCSTEHPSQIAARKRQIAAGLTQLAARKTQLAARKTQFARRSCCWRIRGISGTSARSCGWRRPRARLAS